MFREVRIEELDINPYTMFAKNWAILAAGNAKRGYNGMTISWGLVGSLWNGNANPGFNGLPVCEVFVRPQRHTKRFMDANDAFTVSFFDPEYRAALGYMGSHTGASEDKIVNAGLTPLFTDDTTAFEEASLVFVCRKLYRDALDEGGFADMGIVASSYPDRDFHDAYIGEIVRVLQRA